MWVTKLMKDREEQQQYDQALAENRTIRDPPKAELVSEFDDLASYLLIS
jgi:hypothetical protein